MSYQRILVGVDGSDQADRAFTKACELAKAFSGKVFVVQVVDGDRVAHSPYGGEIAYFEQETARAKKAIEGYLERGRVAQVAIEGDVATGSASHLLAHELPEQYKADLIVLGTTGLSAIERLLLGSRSNFVLRNASVDVLIVR
ncbi:Nucleotide-binding universal stress protein, UspA family [Propionibacterium cyclohexanicum]|uniref:Nucleotide-binding universal stress protein, UspA family n=1 Tax=Propionibacterium cyclohexanicum TaxID=64702 RepID=A0A1H9U1D6_9ACTN|nr:universal stress protein [Propionibacterium cyclohexanicum]SES03275.1 Nucleotide-binding universal stress protein, UspA family [Propionibacterium cyclohexanicum]